MSVFLAAEEEIGVCFNGPMRSGIVLDTQALLNAGYRSFQQQLADRMRELYLGTWEIPAFKAHRNHISFDIGTFQGDTVIPRYLISRAFSGEDLDHILEEFHLPKEVRPMRTIPLRGDGVELSDDDARDAKPIPVVFNLQRIDIYLYDFGYASCMIDGMMVALRDLSAEECRQYAENIGAALPDFSELFQSTIAKVAKTVSPQYITYSGHGEAAKTPAWPGTVLAQHIGEMFWVHRIFSVASKSEGEFLIRRNDCKALVTGERTQGIEDRSLRPDMAIYPGHGTSCVAYIQNVTPEWHVQRLRAVIRAMNVFYAGLQDADRDHFHLNNDTATRLLSREIRTVEGQMGYVAGGIARTGFVKSVYDDYDNQIDPQAFSIWDYLRKTWFMGDLFRALDQKLEMSEKAYERLSRRLFDLQDRKGRQMTSIVVLIFCTALSLPALREQGTLFASIVLAFAFGAATLMLVRYFRTK